MTPKLFSELGLSAEVLKAIDKLGFEQAAPIQAEAIPVLMSGKDVVGQSQTGSGKTAAFAIPAIEKTDANKRAVQVLILCPTRELAVQVSEEVHKLALFKRGIHALPIYGGQSYERQFMGLQQGAQIVIGTPGRVMDHMRRGTLRLDALKMVVLDEVDVMLNMGFRDDIEVILQAAPKDRQTVFFSATIPRPIADLIQRYSRDPQNVRIEQKALTVPTVEQVYYEVDRRYKIELLTRLIDIHDLRLGIIFCNTKRMVDDLVDHLNAQGYSADRLHGDMSQQMRDRVMTKFRKSGLEFLVATDVAARGIDVDDVQVVFNYDLPYDAEDYVHRIGRTGRAGREGRAISFVAGREVFQIRHIERYMNARIHLGRAPSRDDVEEARASQTLDKLRGTLQTANFRRQEVLVGRLLEEGFSSTDIASAVLYLLQGGEPGTPAPKVAPEEARSRPAQSSETGAPPVSPSKIVPPSATSRNRTAEPQEKSAPPPPAISQPKPEIRQPVVSVSHQPPATERPAPAPAAPRKPRAAHPAAPTPPPATVTPPVAAPAGSALVKPVVVAASEANPPTPNPELAPAAKPVAPAPVISEPKQATPAVAKPATVSKAAAVMSAPKPDAKPSATAVTPVSVTESKSQPRSNRSSAAAPSIPQSAIRNPQSSESLLTSAATSSKVAVPASVPVPAASPAAANPVAALPAPEAGAAVAAPAKPTPDSPAPSKHSRATPEGQTRLHVNAGEEMGFTSADLSNVVMGVTGLPATVVGFVDLRARHAFVDVVSEYANGIIAKLNRAEIKGRRLKVKLA